METISFLTVFLSAVLIACQAVPLVPPFTDENGEKESRDFNEVGPDENWQVYGRLMKTKAFDPNGSEKTRVLLKEIEQFSRLAANATADDASSTTAAAAAVAQDTDDDATTERPDGDVVTTEDGQSASDWFGSTWRTLSRDGDDADGRPKSERQDDGNVEDIIRKISNDLKKLYIKIKQVVTVVKNWVNNTRGSVKEYDAPYQMSASATESEGVFVIADPIIADPVIADPVNTDSIIGDIDKSYKYTVPINGD